ncbi:MAG TPA: hypothetical protein VMV05_08245 [bacterium]|nr:hypothetical protein [bacterium]
MSLTKWVLIVSLTGILPAFAANDDLETQEAAYLGERVASYLQTMVTGVSQTMAIKPGANAALNKEPYRATVTYDPAMEAIDISLVGTQSDPATVKEILEFTKKMVLGFNSKLDYNYGIVLGEEDIDMEYLNVLENKTILRYQGGFYSKPDEKKKSP